MSTEPLPSSLSSYKPSSNEKEAYNYLFKKADTESLGVLTGELAVPFFSHSSLPPVLLGEIWQISDPDNNGFLTPERFGVACRLIGHAQEEKKSKGVPSVKQEWVSKSGPLPQFKDYPIPSHLQPPNSSSSPASNIPSSPSSQRTAPPPAPASRLTAQTTGTNINEIKQDDKTRYARLFAGANGGNLTGLLDGEKARDIFIKSNLPYETLGQIWNLADTHSRGSLDLPDFTIGMHLLQLVLNGQLTQEALPKVLDPKMYASATGLNASGTGSNLSSGATPQSPLRQSSIPPPRNIASPPPGPPPPSQPQFQPQQQQQQGWKISQQEKQESDNWFGQLDTNNKGVLEGEQAVGFFGQSGLGVGDLAKIWDLSDITGSGHLTRDTFAVAMKLVREKVSNPSNFQLPDQLPSEYIPPSLRSGTSGSSFPPQQQQQQQQQRSQPQQDLFDLMGDDDTPSTSTTAAAPSSPPPVSGFAPLQPQSTGPIQRSLSPQATGSSFQGLKGTIFPKNTGNRQGSGMISPQVTGQRGGGFQNDFTPSQSTSSSSFAPPQQATSSNFFDDNDLADTTSNLTSLRSQSAQLEKEDQETSQQLRTVSKTREELESEVEKVNEQIKVLHDKVSSSRKQLESERNAVEDLKKRESDQKGVLSRARTELISSESDLSGLKMEKSELEGEFLRDKEEVREVKKRLTMVEEEKRILRGEIEKLKKEGRREKGLGAIARKQLVSAESDRGKLEEDFESLKNAPIQREEEIVQQQPQQALAVPLPISTVTSPTASLRSNNPFDKLNLASAGLSPQPTGQSSASQSNPFPFSASPTTPSFTTSPTTPTQSKTRDLSAEEPVQREPSPQVQDSILPIASAAAGVIGAGALYALETAGSSVTQALGIKSPTTESKPELDGSREIKEEEEVGNKEEVDPFGVPSHLRDDSAPSSSGFDTPASTTNDAGFGDDFGSNSFGDDFASSTETPQPGDKDTAVGTLGEVDRDAGFDEAFDELKPESAKEPEVVEGKLGDLDANEGFDDAFQDFQPGHEATKEDDTVLGTLGEVDNDAGFDDAFNELEETHKVDKGKGKEVVRDEDESEDDIFAEPEEDSKPSVEEIKGEEQFIEHAAKEDIDSSDDEEEGPEDLDRPSAFTRPAQSEDLTSTVPEPATSSAFDSPTQFAKEGNSNSESGESYVHVSSSTAESSGILDADEAPVVSPLPVPTPISSPLPVPSQRRAAPPPPTRTSLLTPAVLPTSEQIEPTSYPVSDDYDAGFDGTRLRSPVEEPVEQSPQVQDSPFPVAQVIVPPTSSFQAPVAPEDDFESSFADMSIQAESPSTKIETSESSKPDFDTFDDDFDFKPSFDGEPSAAASSSAVGQSSTKEDFDDRAFDEFDDSFPATSSSTAPPTTTTTTEPSSFATTSSPAPAQQGNFDDSFGAFPFTDNTTSAPPALAPPVTSAPPPMARMPSVGQGDARDDDSADVKEICGMGFPRSQAIEALAKYDHDLNRAINSLLG